MTLKRIMFDWGSGEKVKKAKYDYGKKIEAYIEPFLALCEER